MPLRALGASNKTQIKQLSPRLQFALKLFLIAVPLALMLRNLHSNWQEMEALKVEISVERLIGVTLMLAVVFCLLPLSTRLVLRILHYDLDYHSSYRSYFLAQLAKYIPGGFWIVPGRVVALKTYGVSSVDSTLATIIELTLLLITALLVFLLNLYSWPSINFQLLLVLTIASLALTSVLWLKRSHFLRLLPQKWRPSLQFNSRAILKIVLIDVAFWLLVGATFYLLAGTAHPMPHHQWPAVIGAFSGAWAAGFLVFLVPSGLGVRDGVLVLLLSSILPEPLPVVIAILARVWWTAAELLSVGIASLIKRRTHTVFENL